MNTSQITGGNDDKTCQTAFYSLAYDVFNVARHGLLDEKLVNRLCLNEQFQGARYELYARALFLHAGFSITLENEDDRLEGHAEFTASRKGLARSFSVEA